MHRALPINYLERCLLKGQSRTRANGRRRLRQQKAVVAVRKLNVASELPHNTEDVNVSQTKQANMASSLSRLNDAIASGDIRQVLLVCGAGISVAAGIPDFRTPGTGLYSNLERYRLPYPEAVFDLSFFKLDPKPFYRLTRALWPGRYAPTRTHHFMKLLAEKGVLRRVYSQNIDTLERSAGIPPDLLVEAHGSFATSACQVCRAQYDLAWMQAKLGLGSASSPTTITTTTSVEHEGSATPSPSSPSPAPAAAAATAGTTPSTGVDADAGDDDEDIDLENVTIPYCDACGGVCKPQIVFYGEELPQRFHSLWKADVRAADLVIVMGTSLQVYPVAGLPAQVRKGVPRVVINREPLWGRSSGYDHKRHALQVRKGGLLRTEATDDGREENGHLSHKVPPGSTALGRYIAGTDVFLHGDSDDGVTALARAWGWHERLLQLERQWREQRMAATSPARESTNAASTAGSENEAVVLTNSCPPTSRSGAVPSDQSSAPYRDAGSAAAAPIEAASSSAGVRSACAATAADDPSFKDSDALAAALRAVTLNDKGR